MERNDRRAERLERAWRERQEDERRRAEQEEERLYGNHDDDSATVFPELPEVTNSRELVRAAMKPADRQKINKETTCRICLSGEEHRCVELACGHHFHKKCVKQWLRRKLMCPLCNNPC